MKLYEYCLDLLLACLILFVAPIVCLSLRQDQAVQLLVTQYTTEFLEQVQTQGYVTIQGYEEFTRRLSTTGGLYDISLEHKQKVFEPEYVLMKDGYEFQGKVYEYYEEKYTVEILKELYQNGEYHFAINDYVTISVKNKSKTTGIKLLYAILRTSNSIETIQSGRVRDNRSQRLSFQ